MSSGDKIESVEALSWLEQVDGKDRTLGEDGDACLTIQAALKLVRELYAAGAVEVVAHIAVVGAVPKAGTRHSRRKVRQHSQFSHRP